ncbi:MAG: peptidoglycan-binding protein [Austwickia sp.]|nr:peptidoglycan-binding protein [Austwickia sp.]MBK8435908.1 peptidoglycan-binding protein [Austwickia sp.]MBK9101594.1 peptidoglycan-binding protein [Austwickia sp.]
MATPRRSAVIVALTAGPLLAGVGPAVGHATPAPTSATVALGQPAVGSHEDPSALGDPEGPVPVQVSGPVAPGRALARTPRRGVSAAAAARLAQVPMPSIALPPTLDAQPGYAGQTSCDPYAKPGTRAYAELLRQTFGMGAYGIERSCTAGGTSEHKEGRAVDWMLNVNDPAQKAVADAATAWLTANNGENARRLGVLYLIWNKQMWRAYAPEKGWQPYVGSSPHTDHIHTSLTWDGAMGRTSWWTGAAVSSSDVGPCRVYRGEYAPLYTGPQYQRCTTALPAAPYSPFPVYVPGQKAANIAVAQRALGVEADGSFGSATRTALLSWQSARGVPRTGVLDKATWAALVPTPAPSVTPVNEPAAVVPSSANQPAQAPPAPSGPVSFSGMPPAPTVVLALPKAVTTRFTPLKRLALRVGSRGAPVRTLQRGLGLKADGRYSASTATAVRALQRATRLPATGRTDLKTWNRIELRVFPWLGYAQRTVAQGSSGAAVIALQRALRVTPDGQFGPVTARAVMVVQQRYGLAPDGVVSGATWRAVFAQAPR